jgi:hypothetical protein
LRKQAFTATSNVIPDSKRNLIKGWALRETEGMKGVQFARYYHHPQPFPGETKGQKERAHNDKSN